MKYVLDTNAMARLVRQEAGTVRRLLASKRSDIFLPEVVLAEMSYGAYALGSTKRARTILAFNRRVREEFQIVRWDADVSDHFGRVKAKLDASGQRIEDFDVAIAAHALALGATLVTANARHFSRIDELAVEDWR